MNRSRVAAPALVALTALVVPSSLLLGSLPASAHARPALSGHAALSGYTALSGHAALSGRPVLSARPAASAVTESRESVVVTGVGEVLGQPDTLNANFAVEATAATVGEALKRANTAAARMRDALVRGGVAKADLQTSNANVSAKQNDKGVTTGYTASQWLTAKIRKLGSAGALMTATIAAGGDDARLNGVSFAIEDDRALLAEARRKAFADARSRAELYARAAGRPLGRVVQVTEGATVGGGGGEQHKYAADSAVPLEPGRQRLTATVTVEWALGPQPPAP